MLYDTRFNVFVSGAVHRYYESRRRLFNDDQPGRKEIAAEVKVKSKRRSLQKKVCWTLIHMLAKKLSCLFITEVRSAFYYPQLYSRRKNFLKSPKESELWASIDCRYMTEESEGEEDKIHQHELPWRSRG